MLLIIFNMIISGLNLKGIFRFQKEIKKSNVLQARTLDRHYSI
jgi:hypothetical protein